MISLIPQNPFKFKKKLDKKAKNINLKEYSIFYIIDYTCKRIPSFAGYLYEYIKGEK